MILVTMFQGPRQRVHTPEVLKVGNVNLQRVAEQSRIESPRSIVRSFGLVSVFLAMPATAPAQEPAGGLRCPYELRMNCTPEGCSPSQIESGYLVVPPLQTLRDTANLGTTVSIQRCDGSGCVPVEVTHHTSEGFLTMSARNGAFLLKIYGESDIPAIGLKLGAFTEVVTSMLMTFVSYGHCSVPEAGTSRVPSPAGSKTRRTL